MSQSGGELLLLGRVATLAGDAGFGWANAVAIRDGRVLAVGDPTDVEGTVGSSARRIALEPGEVAIPGLTDAHLHLADAAKEAAELDLADAPTLAVGLAAIGRADAGLAPGAWLLGRGWQADRWGGWPTADDLERVAAGRAIALWQHDHHALWVSREALRVAGVGASTPDPEGGRLVRDDDGGPTGILLEDAALLVADHIPPLDADALVSAIPAMVDELLALGVVAVHDPATLVPDPGLERALVGYRRLDERGELAIRVHASVRAEALPAARDLGLRSGNPLSSAPDPRARMGWLKLFADGSLGSRTAAMLAPFDDAGGMGLFRVRPQTLRALAATAAEQGIATQIHAIGDAAVRAALDALEPLADRSLPLRPRLEHVQLVDPADVPRFARSGIAASVQPGHLAGDAQAARRAWGDRAERFGYAWGSLAAGGARIPFGTDAPVETLDPWPGIALAVSRLDPGWSGGDDRPFGEAERLTIVRALRAACVDASVVAGETDRGRLVPGQRADLVVIEGRALADPAGPSGVLARVRPRLVLVDGEVAFEA